MTHGSVMAIPVWTLTLLLLVSLLSSTGGAIIREQLGYPIDELGVLYHDDPNLVRQVILMNPSQQIQSDDVLIYNWKVRWDYLRTRIKLQLWRQSKPGFFTLQTETLELSSNSTGNVTFGSGYSLVAQHGDVLGIYLMTQNPIPYRKPVGECSDPEIRVWTLSRQLSPEVKGTYSFRSVSAGDLCRQYLIQPEYKLIEYASGGDTLLMGNLAIERSITNTEESQVILPNPNIGLPFKSTILGWQAYFSKALRKVRFAVLSPNGTNTYYPSYVSEEYLVTKSGMFYARISHTNRNIVPQGSVIALNFTQENPIPYDEVAGCSDENKGLFLPVSRTVGSTPFQMSPLVTKPCRKYSFQLVYEKYEAKYPSECNVRFATPSINEDNSYYYKDGIPYDSTKQCWTVTPASSDGGVIQIIVLNLDLTADDCRKNGLNMVQIRDGDSKDGTLLKTVCPGEKNVRVVGCSKSVHIYLKTTESAGRRGLLFAYRTVPKDKNPCPLALASKSPGYSGPWSSLGVLLLAINALYFAIYIVNH